MARLGGYAQAIDDIRQHGIQFAVDQLKLFWGIEEPDQLEEALRESAD